MGDLAPDITTNPLAIEGLEELLMAQEPGSAQGSANEQEDSSKATPGSAQGLAFSNSDRERDLLQLVVHLSKENGALQALLNEREQQLKLLTDSRHKAGWWARFSSWFVTGR